MEQKGQVLSGLWPGPSRCKHITSSYLPYLLLFALLLISPHGHVNHSGSTSESNSSNRESSSTSAGSSNRTGRDEEPVWEEHTIEAKVLLVSGILIMTIIAKIKMMIEDDDNKIALMLMIHLRICFTLSNISKRGARRQSWMAQGSPMNGRLI